MSKACNNCREVTVYSTGLTHLLLCEQYIGVAELQRQNYHSWYQTLSLKQHTVTFYTWFKVASK